MLRAQQPLHLRQGNERTEKPLCDLLREQTVAVLGKCRGVENPFVDREPDEPAKQQVEQPIAAPSGSNREAATAWPAAGAPAESKDARSSRKAPTTLRRAPPAPRWSVAASPAADGSPGVRASMST